MGQEHSIRTPPSNRIGFTGFVLNLLSLVVFVFMISRPAANPSPNPSAQETNVMQDVVDSLAADLAPIFAATALSLSIMTAGSICCLIGLIWSPRRWAISGILIGPGLISGLFLLKAST